MRIYEIGHNANEFQCLVPANAEDWRRLDCLDGRSLGSEWTCPKIKPLIETKRDSKKPKGDYPSLGIGQPIFSKNALKVLLPLIQDHGEVFKVDIDDRDLYLFNVTRFIDALDLDRSELRWFPSEPTKIMNVLKMVLKGTTIGNTPIFRLGGYYRRTFLVNETFVDLVERNELTGFRFRECEVV